MGLKTRDELKQVFITGAKPQESDFTDLLDSFVLGTDQQVGGAAARKATNAEAEGGTNTDAMMTPATTKVAIDALTRLANISELSAEVQTKIDAAVMALSEKAVKIKDVPWEDWAGGRPGAKKVDLNTITDTGTYFFDNTEPSFRQIQNGINQNADRRFSFIGGLVLGVFGTENFIIQEFKGMCSKIEYLGGVGTEVVQGIRRSFNRGTDWSAWSMFRDYSKFPTMLFGPEVPDDTIGKMGDTYTHVRSLGGGLYEPIEAYIKYDDGRNRKWLKL